MARGGKKETAGGGGGGGDPANPESEERKRLKNVAFSKGLISQSQSNPTAALRPSKTVAKHHAADIIRKSQRKNRFLFSFPGLLAPVSGGKIGDLKDLATKNPILYLDFPQGQMKLFGTIVYPKNRYLTLQFSRGGKNVMCEDYFDTMIVFSDAWWIGRKEENPEEARLELPEELHVEHRTELDFKGGAGGTSELKQSAKKCEPKVAEQESPITDLEEDCSEDQTNLENLQTVTPTRHSERTAGKRFKFAEASSEDDVVENLVDTSEDEDKKEGVESPTRDCSLGKAEISFPRDIGNEDATACSDFPEQVQQSAKSITKTKEISCSNHGSLVQTTISSLFKKVEDEKKPKGLRKTPSSKVAGQDLQHAGSGKGTNKVKDAGPRKKVIDEIQAQAGSVNTASEQPEDSNLVETDKIYKRKRKNDTPSASVNRRSRVTASEQGTGMNSIQADEDEIEEFSSTSKDGEGSSDEDWAG